MNKITVLSEYNSLAQQFITELRDKEIQKDRLRFRRNLERLGELAAFEISKDLPYKEIETSTVLGTSKSKVIEQQPVIGTVLRAGLPMQHGLANYFDQADLAFISAYRKYLDDSTFEVRIEYLACPSLENRILIFADPMLATGKSFTLTLNLMLTHGKPSHIHIVAAVASKQGLAYLNENFSNVSIWIGAVDDTLNAHGYIVPGLGDAGDLAFGPKL